MLDECPICKGTLTPWDKNYVCDVCGFGKRSKNEFKTLQKIRKYRIQYIVMGIIQLPKIINGCDKT